MSDDRLAEMCELAGVTLAPWQVDLAERIMSTDGPVSLDATAALRADRKRQRDLLRLIASVLPAPESPTTSGA